MKYKLNGIFKKRSIQEYGSLLFLLGIFFLPSAFFLGIIFLLPAAILGSFFNDKNFFKDKWNYPLLIFGILICLSALSQNFILTNNYSDIWDPSLSLIGLGNWLPFIYLFWSFQPYLNSHSKRKLLALTLIAGTVPVVFTGFGQYFFNWTGPFKTLYGLIIWYQRPIENPGGLSGLFSNQNYAGSWLNFVWPLCLAFFLEKKKNIFKRMVSLGFFLSVGFAAFLTFSRNAWLGLITTFPIVIEKRRIKILFPLILLIVLIFIYVFSPIFSGDFQNTLRHILPEKILLEFSTDGYVGLDSTRMEIFLSALNLIKLNPIFGTGASSFPSIYFAETSFWKGHSHNILLELAISFGLPATFILFLFVSFIMILSWKLIFLKNKNNASIIDKAYWASLFFFVISQLADIQYFDGRISILAWILIASLKNIIEENNKKEIFTQ